MCTSYNVHLLQQTTEINSHILSTKFVVRYLGIIIIPTSSGQTKLLQRQLGP